MRASIIAAAVLAASTLTGSVAFAEEVIIERARPEPVIVERPAPRVIEERATGGCQTTTVHKENDLGDTKTIKKTDCD